MIHANDSRFMHAALAHAERGRGRSNPNPFVGCIIVRDSIIVGRGHTHDGGRPHAEAMALEQAGGKAIGATAYVTLEPCAHTSTRGPACAQSLIGAGISRVVIALTDPDPRTNGQGIALLQAAGISVTTNVCTTKAEQQLQPYLIQLKYNRPMVTIKLAMSLDGFIALESGESQWITGEAARAHAHMERSRVDAIIIGRGTLEADDPSLDVRLPGLDHRSPVPVVVSHSLQTIPLQFKLAQNPRTRIINSRDPATILAQLSEHGMMHVQVEGGAGLASAFLRADLVDRLMLYRAPILLGQGKRGIQNLESASLARAHGRWQQSDSLPLEPDRLDIFSRVRQS